MTRSGCAGCARMRPGRPTRCCASVVAPLCDGLLAVVEQRWDDAVRLIRPLLPPADADRRAAWPSARSSRTPTCYALVGAGRCEEAVALIDARLDRRPSPLDLRRRTAAAAPSPDPPRPARAVDTCSASLRGPRRKYTAAYVIKRARRDTRGLALHRAAASAGVLYVVDSGRRGCCG